MSLPRPLSSRAGDEPGIGGGPNHITVLVIPRPSQSVSQSDPSDVTLWPQGPLSQLRYRVSVPMIHFLFLTHHVDPDLTLGRAGLTLGEAS